MGPWRALGGLFSLDPPYSQRNLDFKRFSFFERAFRYPVLELLLLDVIDNCVRLQGPRWAKLGSLDTPWILLGYRCENLMAPQVYFSPPEASKCAPGVLLGLGASQGPKEPTWHSKLFFISFWVVFRPPGTCLLYTSPSPRDTA